MAVAPDEAAHKAMLYFLEILMNSNGALSISQLAGRFGSKSFTPEMREAAGGNEAGLRRFLQKYPSLFMVNANSVSLNNTHVQPMASSTGGVNSSPDKQKSTETLAVEYFRLKLARKEEKWVPIVCLAGHLSQASTEIRQLVGAQSEFKSFIQRYPSVFVVQGDRVSLREPPKPSPVISIVAKPMTVSTVPSVPSTIPVTPTGMAPIQTSMNVVVTPVHRVPSFERSLIIQQPAPSTIQQAPPATRVLFEEPQVVPQVTQTTATTYQLVDIGRPRSKSLSQVTRSPSNPNLPVNPALRNQMLRTTSIGMDPQAFAQMPTHHPTIHQPALLEHALPTTTQQPAWHPPSLAVPRPGSKEAPVQMSANEYKALMFIKGIVERKGPIKLHNITGHFSQAPESIRSTIGWTKYELEEFIKLHSVLFHLENEVVSLNKNAKMNVIITGTRPVVQAVRALNARKAKVFHVAKLWGIIDLGKHEHVFFDRSIFPKNVDDLQKFFQVGELVYFNAVLAPKNSRAKWRATKVWKDDPLEVLETKSDTSGDTSLDMEANHMTVSNSIEEELRRLLPEPEFEMDWDSTNDVLLTTELVNQASTYDEAALSNTGVVPVWNFVPTFNSQSSSRGSGDNPNNADELGGMYTPTLSMVPETYFMNLSAISDIHAGEGFRQVPQPQDLASPTGTGLLPRSPRRRLASASKMASLDEETEIDVTIENRDEAVQTIDPRGLTGVDQCCQTLVTGDILATQLYHDKSKAGSVEGN